MLDPLLTDAFLGLPNLDNFGGLGSAYNCNLGTLGSDYTCREKRAQGLRESGLVGRINHPKEALSYVP